MRPLSVSLPSCWTVFPGIAGAAFLGGAFVFTIAGTQYYGMQPFYEIVKLDQTVYAQIFSWIAAVSGGYVMVFSRGTKLYDDIQNYRYRESKVFSINADVHEQKKSLTSWGKSTLLLGVLAGIARGLSLGYTSTVTFANAFFIYDPLIINSSAIYVCLSNTVAYLHFTLLKAVENAEYLGELIRGDVASPQQTMKKLLTLMAAIPSTIATFGYFYFSIYDALDKAPLVNALSTTAKISSAVPITGISVTVGGISKGVQFFRYLTESETKASEKNLQKVSSCKIASHKTFGFLYTLTYFIVSAMGLLVFMRDKLGWNQSIAFAPAVLFGFMGTLMEYAFSTRYMIIEAEQEERSARTSSESLFFYTNGRRPLLDGDIEITNYSMY